MSLLVALISSKHAIVASEGRLQLHGHTVDECSHKHIQLDTETILGSTGYAHLTRQIFSEARQIWKTTDPRPQKLEAVKRLLVSKHKNVPSCLPWRPAAFIISISRLNSGMYVGRVGVDDGWNETIITGGRWGVVVQGPDPKTIDHVQRRLISATRKFKGMPPQKLAPCVERVIKDVFHQAATMSPACNENISLSAIGLPGMASAQPSHAKDHSLAHATATTSGTVFAIVDDVRLIHLPDDSMGNSSGAYQGTWNVHTTYDPGNQVTYDGIYWMSTAASTGQTPSTTSTYWELARPTKKLTAVNGSNQATTSSIASGSINKLGAASFTGASIGVNNTLSTVATLTLATPLDNGDQVMIGINITSMSGLTNNAFLIVSIGGGVYTSPFVDYLWGKAGTSVNFQWPGADNTTSLDIEIGTSQTTGPVTVTGSVYVTNQRKI